MMPKTDATNTDVIIAGAGPTGLMAALLLHKCGISLRIFDKGEQQAHESRAFALQARSLELMLGLGIADEFIHAGLISPGLKLYVNNNLAATMPIDDIGDTDSPYSFVLMLPQSHIEKIMIEHLAKAGINIERNSELTGITQADESVTVTINQQGQARQFNAKYVIGADGAHSKVRDVLGLSFAGSAYPQNFMLADCKISWPLEYSFIKLFMRKHFLGIYFPIKGTEYGRVISVNPDTGNEQDSAQSKLATTAEPLSLPEVEKAFQEATGSDVKLSDPIWVARYRIHHRSVNKYREGRVFVAGDAAHIHSPAGGQGMNTGLQDAANLAWKIALSVKRHGSDELLDTYNAERWPVGQKLLHFTDRLFSGVSSQNAVKTALRNFFVPLIMKTVTHFRPCRKRAFNFISELGIRYHKNPFVQDNLTKHSGGFSAKLSAGHRAPNAIYKRNQDVFSLINNYEFNVLALSKQALSESKINEIAAGLAALPKDIGLPLHTHFIAHSLIGETDKFMQAEINQVFENYGLSNANPFGLFLVRPDGYIAYRSDQLSIATLANFCELFSGKKPLISSG
jgi:2-polyprenyl-6-methoxyphenol hydroxylase-like FAD-dependent oxidoreductase